MLGGSWDEDDALKLMGGIGRRDGGKLGRAWRFTSLDHTTQVDRDGIDSGALNK